VLPRSWYSLLVAHPAEKPQQTPLGRLLAVGVGVSATLGFIVLSVFALLSDGRGWWIADHHLTTAQWYDVVRSTIASMGVFGIGAAGLLAYRRQKTSEATHQLSVQLREDSSTVDLRARFATAAGQLGNASAAVRLAGVYAMAALADDWHTAKNDVQIQVCIDVLCAYLRIPYDPNSTKAGRGEREVRLTVISVIRDHLQDPDVPTTWCGRNLDFTGATFDGGNFTEAQFTGGFVDFSGATFSGAVTFHGAAFSGGIVDFSRAEFSVDLVDFRMATFSAGTVTFDSAGFTGGTVNFRMAEFSGGDVDFRMAEFSGGDVNFVAAKFSGGTVTFIGAVFSAGTVTFIGAAFSAGHVTFIGAEFSGGDVDFRGAEFSGGDVTFHGAGFTGGTVDFRVATFAGGTVTFDDATFSAGHVTFTGAEFSGGTVTFALPHAWTAGPTVDWTDTAPGGVTPTEWPPTPAASDPDGAA
jgi:uncharacterized protein YjbI with pentapeptide repeats